MFYYFKKYGIFMLEEVFSMKCRRIGLEANVEKYVYGQGLEDGVEKWTKVVINTSHEHSCRKRGK